MFVVLFCLNFLGPFSGQPDISQDCQISQLGSPADCQIFWSYFYPCMLWLQCYDLNKVSLNLVSMDFVSVAVSEKFIFLFVLGLVVFAAENAAVHDGIACTAILGMHSFFSRFQWRAYVNHANRPITEQMLHLLRVLSSRIKHQKRKLYCRPQHKRTNFPAARRISTSFKCFYCY